MKILFWGFAKCKYFVYLTKCSFDYYNIAFATIQLKWCNLEPNPWNPIVKIIVQVCKFNCKAYESGDTTRCCVLFNQTTGANVKLKCYTMNFPSVTQLTAEINRGRYKGVLRNFGRTGLRPFRSQLYQIFKCRCSYIIYVVIVDCRQLVGL